MVLEFRIWQFCQPFEWNVTAGQIAAALDEHVLTVSSALRRRQWSSRIRAAKKLQRPPGFRAFEGAMVREITGRTRRQIAGEE